MKAHPDEDPGYDLWWRIAAPIIEALVRLLFRVSYVGLGNIPDRGPAVLAANHVSVLDGPALAVPPTSKRHRPIRFVTAAEAFRLPIAGWMLRTFEQIPIRRGAGDAGALDAAVATVRRGELAGIFPEGRVNPKAGGRLQRGRTGLARISLAAGAPVIPAGIWGTQRRWPRGGPTLSLPLRPRLVISFGEPVLPKGDPDDPDDLERFTERVMEAIALQVTVARERAEPPR